MHVFVAIPAYDGKITAPTLDALMAEQLLAREGDDVLDVRVLSGCSSIPAARNSLLADFEASSADRLFFLDSDIAWRAGALMRLAYAPYDVIGGAYRNKREAVAYVVRWLPEGGPLWADGWGALEVAGLGAGFLSLSRKALAAMRAAMPERVYRDGEREIYAYCDMPFADGTMWGEDLRLCELMRRAGVPIHVDPELELSHVAGPGVAFKGRLGDWLRERMALEEQAA